MSFCLTNTNKAPADKWDPSRVVNPRPDNPDHEEPPKGSNSVKFPGNNLPLHKIEVPVRLHNG